MISGLSGEMGRGTEGNFLSGDTQPLLPLDERSSGSGCESGKEKQYLNEMFLLIEC